MQKKDSPGSALLFPARPLCGRRAWHRMEFIHLASLRRLEIDVNLRDLAFQRRRVDARRRRRIEMRLFIRQRRSERHDQALSLRCHLSLYIDFADT